MTIPTLPLAYALINRVKLSHVCAEGVTILAGRGRTSWCRLRVPENGHSITARVQTSRSRYHKRRSVRDQTLMPEGVGESTVGADPSLGPSSSDNREWLAAICKRSCRAASVGVRSSSRRLTNLRKSRYPFSDLEGMSVSRQPAYGMPRSVGMRTVRPYKRFV